MIKLNEKEYLMIQEVLAKEIEDITEWKNGTYGCASAKDERKELTKQKNFLNKIYGKIEKILQKEE
jgi:hypothetical protein